MSETTEPGQPADPIRPRRTGPPAASPNPNLGPPDAGPEPEPLDHLAPGDAATRFGGSAPFSGMTVLGGAAAPTPPPDDHPPADLPPAEHRAGSPVQEWLSSKPDLATGLEPAAARDLAIGPSGRDDADDATDADRSGQGLASDGPASGPEQPTAGWPPAERSTPEPRPAEPPGPGIPATLVGTVDASAIEWAEALAGRPADLLPPPPDPGGEPNRGDDPDPVPLSGHELAAPPEPPAVRDRLAGLSPEPPADPWAIPLAGPPSAEPARPDHAARVPLDQPIPATLVSDRRFSDSPVPATIVSDRRPEDLPVPATLVGTVGPPPDDLAAAADAPPAAHEPPAAEPGTVVPVPPAVEPELAVAAESIPMTIMGETAAVPPPGGLVPVGPVMTMASEPTPIELAAVPPEPAGAIPVAALAPAAAAGAAGAAAAAADHEAHHGQTAAAVFAHAHEDVEARRGVLSYGLLTKAAGVAGLLACVAGMAVMLVACAGLAPARSENLLFVNWHVKWTAVGLAALALVLVAGAIVWRGLVGTAVATAVFAVLTGALWFGIARYHPQLDGFNALVASPYIVYAGAGGLALAVLGGLIEHRRMREETHVLAAVFTNAAAAVGGALLWVVQLGWKII